MRAGRLRHRITIQQQATTQDAYGETTGAWADVADVWAQITPVSGTEDIQKLQTENNVSHTISIRWRDGLTPRNRITFNDRVFNIHSVRAIDEQEKELALDCVEVVGQSA